MPDPFPHSFSPGRLYPISHGSNKSTADSQYLAIMHSGVKLVRRVKSLPTDYLEVRAKEGSRGSKYKELNTEVPGLTQDSAVCSVLVSHGSLGSLL